MKELIAEMIKSWNEKGEIDNERLELQYKLAKEIFDKVDEGRLFILNLPTGIGKTEIFLAPFFYQFKVNDFFAGRMYIVEPTHALLTQMRDRVCNHVIGLQLDIPVGEDHGDVENPTFLYTAPITLTTIDSFAYGFLAKRVNKWWKYGYETGRYTLPVGLMGNSYIVFDEAHLIQDSVFLSPRVMGKIICNLVNSGAIVVFSSATLPKALLERLTRECKKVENLTVDLNVKRDVKITFNGDKQLTENEIDCEGNTLVILNTVERARSLYKKLRDKCKNVYILHSLMAIEDRRKVYDSVKIKMNNEDDLVLIGTQTLEVGLDFSFEKLYAEISPIDSLIQRVGRIGRRKEKKNEKSKEVNAIIFDVENNLPYLDSIIKATKDVLHSSTAYDNLVNSIDTVYDENKVKEIEEKGDLFYVEFLEYIENLHLFSYPPEDEVLVRPSNYIIIFILDDSLIESESDKELVLRKDGLDDKSLKYSISLVDNHSLKRLTTLLNGRNVYSYPYEKGGKIHVKKVTTLDRIINNALSIYVRKDDLYDEAGLKVELDKPKSESEGKKRRSKKK